MGRGTAVAFAFAVGCGTDYGTLVIDLRIDAVDPGAAVDLDNPALLLSAAASEGVT